MLSNWRIISKKSYPWACHLKTVSTNMLLLPVNAFPTCLPFFGAKFEDFVVPITVNSGQSRRDLLNLSKSLKTPEHGGCQVFCKILLRRFLLINHLAWGIVEVKLFARIVVQHAACQQ